MSVCTAKCISGPLTWWCRLPVFTPTQSLQWSLMQLKTRDVCLSCLYAFLTQDQPHVCSPHPWRTCGSGPLEGAMLRMHRQPLPSTAAVMCCSPPLCLLLLFVRWPFGVVSGSSVSLLCSLKWDQAKAWSLESIILDITFSRCLVLDKQARLGNVGCQFRPRCPGMLPL